MTADFFSMYFVSSSVVVDRRYMRRVVARRETPVGYFF
jgi:hypothetical protein